MATSLQTRTATWAQLVVGNEVIVSDGHTWRVTKREGDFLTLERPGAAPVTYNPPADGLVNVVVTKHDTPPATEEAAVANVVQAFPEAATHTATMPAPVTVTTPPVQQVTTQATPPAAVATHSTMTAADYDRVLREIHEGVSAMALGLRAFGTEYTAAIARIVEGRK